MKLGLIADVFGDAEFSAKSMEVLETLSHLPTKAIALTKKHSIILMKTFKEQLDLEGIYQQDAAETQDFKEGVTAF